MSALRGGWLAVYLPARPTARPRPPAGHTDVNASVNTASSLVHRIVVHAGVYPPFTLDAMLDSGDARTTIEIAGADGEIPPIVSAGLPLPAASWSAASGPGFKPGTLVTDLTKAGISPAQLGSLPDNGNAQNMSDTHWVVYWGLVCEQQKLQKVQLFHGGAPSRAVPPHLARFPNVDPATGRWRFLHANDTYRPRGGPVTGLVPPSNVSARVLGWATAEDAHLHGCEHTPQPPQHHHNSRHTCLLFHTPSRISPPPPRPPPFLGRTHRTRSGH